jgi:hypothetical protein
MAERQDEVQGALDPSYYPSVPAFIKRHGITEQYLVWSCGGCVRQTNDLEEAFETPLDTGHIQGTVTDRTGLVIERPSLNV